MQTGPRMGLIGVVGLIGLLIVAGSPSAQTAGTRQPVEPGSLEPSGVVTEPARSRDAESRLGGTLGAKALPDECERTARRAYERCMDGSADRLACMREHDDAELACRREPGDEAEADGSERSQGLYRIPYADGTKVHVSRDFYDHNPEGKLDMAGRGGGTYRIVAAAPGVIRHIQDYYSRQQHPMRWLRRTDDCYNNYVWIEHDNGEWSKYSHLREGTTTGAAGLSVGDRVEAGTYLGDEGKVGCAWPAHLHWEVIEPPDDFQGEIADPSGALKGIGRGHRRNPRIAGVEGGVLQDGRNYFAEAGPACRNDDDCDPGFWCNQGVDFSKNLCLPLKEDGETCAAVGGGHQCRSGHCRFSRCYTPGSVPMGGVCYNDDACREGKCSAADGFQGVCVCKKDKDCGSGQWCDAGLDLKRNACRAKLDEGEKCGAAGTFGNDHKCKSGKCSGFPKYVCK